jgi:kinesin family protein 2/24
MGLAESALRNVDKRTGRRENKSTYVAEISQYRASFSEPAEAYRDDESRPLRVFVRKRPLFRHEDVDQGEFDVVTCGDHTVVVHDARIGADCRSRFMVNTSYSFDRVFAETTSNAEVCSAVRCCIHDVVAGGAATVMMYGQTGSGKTYTMTAVYADIAESLFEQVQCVSVQVLDLCGDVCRDGLCGAGDPVQLRTGVTGEALPWPSIEVEVRSGEELRCLVEHAAHLRTTAETGVHAQSSRSHLVVRVFVQTGKAEGLLTLVDLAGSETRIDSDKHDARRRAEGAQINASLMALKACVRAKAARERYIPYRQAKLTQVLKRCFDDERAVTYVIATVSPASKDTEHTMNTLSHAGLMDGQGDSASVKEKVQLPPIDLGSVARARRADPNAKDAKAGGGLGGPRPKEVPVQSETQKSRERKRRDREGFARLGQDLTRRVQAARKDKFENSRQWQRLSYAMPIALLEDVQREQREGATKRSFSPSIEVLSPGDRRGASTIDDAPQLELPIDAAERRKPTAVSSADGRSGRPKCPSADEAKAEREEQPGGDPGADNAFSLYWKFVDQGRASHSWSKNDLRLINAFVVPRMFPGESLPWAAGVEVALDTLTRLVDDHPHGPRYGYRAGDDDSFSAERQRTPQRRGNTPASEVRKDRPGSGVSSQRTGKPPITSGRTTPATRPGSGQSGRTDGTDFRQAEDARRRTEPQLTRHEQAKRHREAKAAEQGAVLEQRVKAKTRDRDGEIARIEQVLAKAGDLSSAAVAGMRRQLASLKAAKLRAEKKKPEDHQQVLHDASDSAEKPQSRYAHNQDLIAEVNNEEMIARDLFAEFLHYGRGGRVWRANELRLLNAFILPKEFPGEKLTWQRVELALDELEGLVGGDPVRSTESVQPQALTDSAPPRREHLDRGQRDPVPPRDYRERDPGRQTAPQGYRDDGRDRDIPVRDPRYEANAGWDRRSCGAPAGEVRGYDARPSYGSPASDIRPRAQVVYGAGTAPWGNALNDPQD